MFKQQGFLGLIKKRQMSRWEDVSESSQIFSISLLKSRQTKALLYTGPTLDWVKSRNMAARPSSSMSLSVFMATFRIWMGSSWALWMPKQKKIFHSKIHNHAGQWQAGDYQKSVLITLLSSSPYKTGLPPSGKVGLGGGESEKQLNTSVMFL